MSKVVLADADDRAVQNAMKRLHTISERAYALTMMFGQERQKRELLAKIKAGKVTIEPRRK